MYDYPQYKEPEKEAILAFMKAHPFIMLIGSDKKGRIELTQVPVMIEDREGKLFLRGHMARKSSHHHAFDENPEVLAVFTGPHTYVSATWYSGSPNLASTWNYVSIHARGAIKWMTEEEMTGLLQQLSLHYESYNNGATPVYENLPDDYRSKMIKAIIGFEVEVNSLENIYKLSQNRDERSYDNIVKELKGREGDAKIIGSLMEERKPKVFRP